jgi:hypothetical protein
MQGRTASHFRETLMGQGWEACHTETEVGQGGRREGGREGERERERERERVGVALLFFPYFTLYTLYM